MNKAACESKKIYFGLDISQKTIEIFSLIGETGRSLSLRLVQSQTLNLKL